MSQKVDPQKLADFSEGIIQNISSDIIPENSVSLSVNLDFDKYMGDATVRKGTQKLGDKLTGECKGIHHFVKSDGSGRLLAAFGSDIYSYESGTWTQRTTTDGSKVRFLTFIDTVLAIDGTTIQASEDGVTWVENGTALDIDNAPDGKVAINWKDRVYMAGDPAHPDRLYFSSLYGVPTDDEISWTDETAGYIDIDPEDGAGGIVGLAKVPGYLLIFKERSIHRWDGRALAPESLIRVGTKSQESHTLGRENLFFWNERGVFITNGGYPEKASIRIRGIIENTNPDFDISCFSDAENVYISVGNIEIEDMEFNNLVLVFNIEMQVWTTYKFDHKVKFLTRYIDGKEKVVYGDDDGQVWVLNQGNNDDGNSIDYHLMTQEIDFGHRANQKDMNKFIVFNRGIRNATLFGKKENGGFQNFGFINKDIAIINKHMNGRYFKFRISGTSESDVQIKGLELSEISISYGNQER